MSEEGWAAHVRSHAPTNLVPGLFGMIGALSQFEREGGGTISQSGERQGGETSSVREQEGGGSDRERRPGNARPRGEQQQSSGSRNSTEQRCPLMQEEGSSVGGGASCGYLPKKGRTLRRGCSSRPHTSRLRGSNQGALSECLAACLGMQLRRPGVAQHQARISGLPPWCSLTSPAAAARSRQA